MTTSSTSCSGGDYGEIILETAPSHVSHWLHVDLSERIAGLGYPVKTVTGNSLRARPARRLSSGFIFSGTV